MVVATAFHEPDKLDSLFKPTVSEALDKAESDPGAWETDEWWKTAT